MTGGAELGTKICGTELAAEYMIKADRFYIFLTSENNLHCCSDWIDKKKCFFSCRHMLLEHLAEIYLEVFITQ